MAADPGPRLPAAWAVGRGAVLYEMVSGTRAFAGNTVAEILSAVLRDDPPP